LELKGDSRQGQKRASRCEAPPGFHTNGMPSLQAVAVAVAAAAPADERISWRARGDIGGGVHRGSELGAAASTKAVLWGMRLASLLTHLFVFCTVTDFSAAERDRGVKFCVRVGLLSEQVFSPFGEVDLWGVTGAAALLPG